MPGTDKEGLEAFQKDLAQRLGRIGVTGKETNVVYESNLGMRAPRVAWMLEYAGSPKVFLLEGGFNAWRRSHFKLEKTERKLKTTVFHIRPNSKLLATAEEIASKRKGIILDVRSEGEFTGRENRDCDRRRGRIPGARWLEWTNFLNDGDRFRNRSEMDSMLKRVTLNRGQQVVTYCHRGARAAAAYYALRSLGYTNVKNYIGSWHEWSSRNNLPVERGTDQDERRLT